MFNLASWSVLYGADDATSSCYANTAGSAGSAGWKSALLYKYDWSCQGMSVVSLSDTKF